MKRLMRKADEVNTLQRATDSFMGNLLYSDKKVQFNDYKATGTVEFKVTISVSWPFDTVESKNFDADTIRNVLTQQDNKIQQELMQDFRNNIFTKYMPNDVFKYWDWNWEMTPRASKYSNDVLNIYYVIQGRKIDNINEGL